MGVSGPKKRSNATAYGLDLGIKEYVKVNDGGLGSPKSRITALNGLGWANFLQPQPHVDLEKPRELMLHGAVGAKLVKEDYAMAGGAAGKNTLIFLLNGLWVGH